MELQEEGKYGKHLGKLMKKNTKIKGTQERQRKEMVEDFPVAFRNVDGKIMQTTRITSGTSSVSSD